MQFECLLVDCSRQWDQRHRMSGCRVVVLSVVLKDYDGPRSVYRAARSKWFLAVGVYLHREGLKSECLQRTSRSVDDRACTTCNRIARQTIPASTCATHVCDCRHHRHGRQLRIAMALAYHGYLRHNSAVSIQLRPALTRRTLCK